MSCPYGPLCWNISLHKWVKWGANVHIPAPWSIGDKCIYDLITNIITKVLLTFFHGLKWIKGLWLCCEGSRWSGLDAVDGWKLPTILRNQENSSYPCLHSKSWSFDVQFCEPILLTQIPTYIYIDIVYIYSIGLNHEKTFLLEPYRDPVVVWKVRNLPGSSSCSEAGERRVADGVSLACGTGAPKKNPRFHHWKRDLRLGTFSFFLRSQQSLLLMVANITHHQSFAIGITRLLC